MPTGTKKDFNKTFANFVRSAKKATQKAANKTMELADIASLNLKLQGLNIKLSEKFEELGKLSYKKLSGVGEVSETPETEPDPSVDRIAGIIEEIDGLYDQISRLKAEIKSKKAQNKGKNSDNTVHEVSIIVNED